MIKKFGIKERINKDIKINEETIINFVYLFVFGIITLITVIMHECWRDESQAWLLARDIPIFDLLFSQLRFEGHPGLWYIIIAPLAKLGAPFEIINYLSWAIMMVAAYLFVFKSKVDKFTKIAFLFTTPFLFYYTVIARSYSVLTLLMILICYFYGKRKEHPIILAVLIALLMNTHVLGLGFAGIIAFLTYIIDPIVERKKLTKIDVRNIIIALSIIIFAGLLFLFQIKPWMHSNTVIDTDVSRFTLEQAYTRLLASIKVIVGNLVYYKFLYNVYYVLVPLMLFLGIRYFKREVLICLVTLLFQIFVFAFVIGSLMHTTIIIIITLGCYLWLVSEKAHNGTKREKIVAAAIEIIAFILFAINIVVACQYVIFDIQHEFSASKKTAYYINNNIENGANFITTYDIKAQPVIPYTNKNYHFISLETKKEFTYITWDESRKTFISYNDVTKCIDEKLNENKPVYLLYVYGNLADYVVKLEDDYNLKKVFYDYNTYAGVVRESYVIYKIENKN